MSQGEADLVRTIQELTVKGRRGKGRPELIWEQVIRADMSACGVDGTLAQDKRA